MLTRVSTQAVYTTAISDINATQTRLAKLQEQISSGRDASTFSELGSRTLRTLDLEEEIAGTEKYVRNNDVIVSRLRQQDISISLLEDVASEIRSQIALKRSPSGNAVDLTNFVDNTLERMKDALNIEQAGRFLFSGSKTERPPIAETGFATSNLINEEPTDSYYQGDYVRFGVQASDNLEIEYGVTAGEPAIQKLIGSLFFVKEAETYDNYSDDQEAFLLKALDNVNQSIQELAGVRNKIGNDIVSLEDTNDTHARLKEELTIVLNDLTGTDVVDASIQISLSESVLQATLQTFARISDLKLSDFLR